MIESFLLNVFKMIFQKFSDSFKCANEEETCYCSGTVTYGKDSTWTSPKKVENHIGCTNAMFKDPLPNKRKECHCTMSGTFSISLAPNNNIILF